MKKTYSITYTRLDDGSLTIKRENEGFHVFELLGMLESTKAELLIQSSAMCAKDASVERIVHVKDKDLILEIETVVKKK